MASDELAITVVYAQADRQQIVNLRVAVGTTVEQAVALSGLTSGGAIDVSNCAIFGRAVALNQPVSDGDRIEILRPLLIDPKESRRQAAAKARQKTR